MIWSRTWKVAWDKILMTYLSIVPKSHLGSLLNGILIPWNFAIFSATSAEMLGLLNSHVSSLRLYQWMIIQAVTKIFSFLALKVHEIFVSTHKASHPIRNYMAPLKQMYFIWNFLVKTSYNNLFTSTKNETKRICGKQDNAKLYPINYKTKASIS